MARMQSWCVVWVVATIATPALFAQGTKYPPLERYLMPRVAEVALAQSAAPANISDRATIKVLTSSGYRAAQKGENGFVCMVMRGWSAPTYTPVQFRGLVYDPAVLAPICFDPEAARTVMPYYEFRSKLAMEGKTPDEIAAGLESALARGALPERARISFAYMWSADQNLGPGIGHWHPHMMVFAPYYTNTMLGANEFAKPVPFVSDDAGTPFAVAVIPVADSLAIKAESGASTRR